MASNIFTILNYITWDKKPWDTLLEEEKNCVQPFMIHRYVSMKQEYIEVANVVQKYNLTPKAVYDFYCELLPKRKVFLKYIKGGKKYDADKLEMLSDYLQCSQREIKDIIHLYTDEELKEISNQIKGNALKKKAKK
jgi:uncharacterized protein (DUF433 family)